MLDGYIALLIVHLLLALASPVLLATRLWRSLQRAPAQTRWLRVTPFAVDGLLLVSGVALGRMIGEYPFVNPWLTAKLLAFAGYLGAGRVALRRARDARPTFNAALISLALLLYLFAVAVTHDAAAGML